MTYHAKSKCRAGNHEELLQMQVPSCTAEWLADNGNTDEKIPRACSHCCSQKAQAAQMARFKGVTNPPTNELCRGDIEWLQSALEQSKARQTGESATSGEVELASTSLPQGARRNAVLNKFPARFPAVKRAVTKRAKGMEATSATRRREIINEMSLNVKAKCCEMNATPTSVGKL